MYEEKEFEDKEYLLELWLLRLHNEPTKWTVKEALKVLLPLIK